jgi:hypothetical protein
MNDYSFLNDINYQKNIHALVLFIISHNTFNEFFKYKELTEQKALEFVNTSGNQLLYSIYQGYCLGYVLLNNTRNKHWKNSDFSIVKSLHPFVLEIVTEDNKTDICKLIRMLYFLELIQNDKTETRATTFYQIFFNGSSKVVEQKHEQSHKMIKLG